MKTNFIKTVILLLSICGSAQAASLSEEIPYYGAEFYRDLKSGVANEDLSQRLKTVLKSVHTPLAGALDKITSECAGPKCYQHVPVGYNNARVFLLGKFYLIQDENGYGVKDVYCDRNHMRGDFSEIGAPGPDKVPDSTIINVEHTWPQSRFTSKYGKDMQKSDLHHLFPTDSQMNSVRGNDWFGEVVKDTKTLKCKNVRFGKTAQGGPDVFEPPKEHRGNVARALFYFSTRYDLPIGDQQEEVLRKWNNDDPVDAEEQDRNNKIAEAQGNRNPFVDYPEIADKLHDF